jgi:ferredoxin-thioredoxin reductase catalytic subunit
MNREELRRAWERFTEKNDFMLNPDGNFVDAVMDGVLENEKRYGLKLCPCRLRDGTREGDLSLICPCNFKAQEVWAKEGRCWCGLFVKRDK